MSTATALDLLDHADTLTRQLRSRQLATSPAHWDSFDVTVHRLLLELIGPDAVHVRIEDPGRLALQTAIRTYPTPLRPPVHEAQSRTRVPDQTEPETEQSRMFPRRGHLHLLSEGHDHLAASDPVRPERDIRPADPTDEHPVARLACTLGAMADLVHETHRTEQPLPPASEAAGAVIHVLSLAAVTARHLLAHSPLDDAIRPLRVGGYAEHVIDTLRDLSLRPVSLDRLASIAPHPAATTPQGRLEAAIYTWQSSGRQELTRSVPSVDVLRQIANQGIHMCQVRQLLDPHPPPDLVDALHAAAADLAKGQQAWDQLTTLMRPGHEFVTASRDLYEALTVVAETARSGSPDLDRGRSIADLGRGLQGVTQLIAMTRTLPNRLLVTNILQAPAEALRKTDDRIHDRLRARHVRVRPDDVPHLQTTWLAAARSLDGLDLRLRPPQELSLLLER